MQRVIDRALPLLFIAACGSKATGDETAEADEKDPVELLDEACDSFCERAMSCPSGRYAELWKFDDHATCVSQCLEFHADVQSDPPEMCLIVRADLWSCVGAIESCELFAAFEDISFAIPNVLGNPCKPEFDVFMHKCNG